MLKRFSKCSRNILVLLWIFLKDIKALNVSMNRNITAAIGITNIQLRCSITFANDENVNIIHLKTRNKTGDDNYVLVAIFFMPPRQNKAYLSENFQYMDGRVKLENPTKSLPDAVLTFIELQCIDDNDYRCEINYDINGQEILTKISNPATLTIQSNSTKPDSIFPTSPLFEVLDDQNVSFICKGNIGKPPGKFIWKKFQYNEHFPVTYYDVATTSYEVAGNCSCYGTSNLTIELTASDNNATIVCVEQSLETFPKMAVNIGPINVYYKVRGIIVTKYPDMDIYHSRAIDCLNLTCNAEGNPKPMYTWFREDNYNTILSTKNILSITRLAVNKSGNYVCRAYNNISGSFYNDTKTISITIEDTQFNSESSDNSNRIYIATGCGIIIVIIVIALVVRYKRSKQNGKQKQDGLENVDEQDNVQHIQLAQMYSTVKDENKAERSSSIFREKDSNQYAEVSNINNGAQFKPVTGQIKENEHM